MSRAIYNPDCGHAWMVVAACFVINFIMAGLLRAAGVLYVALINVYGVSRETATMPFSLRFCVRNMSGPLVGALGQRFGVRPVVIMGGFMCGLGGILSFLAPDVTWITFAWGGIHGLGYGFCNIIHVLMINRYFNKYKGIALGINYTGDCFGTFLLPILLDFLLEVYGLRGTFLILAGISLNVVPAAMLLISPPWEEEVPAMSYDNVDKKVKKTSIFENSEVKIAEGDTNGEIKILYDVFPAYTANELKINQKTEEIPDVLSSTEKNTGEITSLNVHAAANFNSHHRVSDYNIFNDIHRLRTSRSFRLTDVPLSQKRRGQCNAINKMRTNSQVSAISCPSNLGKTLEGGLNKSQYLHPSSAYLQESTHNKICYDHNRRKSSVFNETLNFNTALDSDNEQKVEKLVYPIAEIPIAVINVHNCVDLEDEIHPCSQETRQQKPCLEFLKTNIKPMFLIISLTMAMYVFLFISVFTIIIDYASDNNVPSDIGKYLILCFSVTDVFGRIGFGMVLDKKMISLHNFAGFTTGLMGICILVIPLYKCFKFWIISFSVCGFIQGGTCIMFPLLVEYYMEKNETSIALGCLNFYGGLLMLPVAPMIGFFRDSIGSYDGVFWTVGTLCTLSGCLWIFEPCIVRKKDAHVCPNLLYCEENNQIQEKIKEKSTM